MAYVSDSLFPSALRELREDLTKRPIIVGGLALGIILGISGPFDTLRDLTVVPRLIYWITVVALTYATGSLISNLVHDGLKQSPNWLRLACSTSAIGLAVTLILSVLNLAVFALWPANWTEFLRLLGTVTVISGVIELCGFAIRTGRTSAQPETAPLLQRLPLEKRGAVVALSAEDHYVRVSTTQGTELVLMRLSDAIKEVGATPGLQIHRSHWVGLDQITKVARLNGGGEVTLSDGTTRPVSRKYMSAVRAKGLLPSKPTT